MIFSKVFNRFNPIQTFDLSVTSGVEENAIAFGPASTINGTCNFKNKKMGSEETSVGNVKLFLDKPVKVKSIRVTFKCEQWDYQKKENTVLFAVESSILPSDSKAKLKKEIASLLFIIDEQGEPLEVGSHLYLFAIQLPSYVNYPPTIKESYFGHKIEYSLTAHLQYWWDNNLKEKATSPVFITYLPLVTFNDQMNRKAQSMKNTIQIKKGSEYIDISASLVNPSSCPGKQNKKKKKTLQ